MSGSGKPSVKRGALVFYAHLSNDWKNKELLSNIKTHEKWSKTLDCENKNNAVVGGVGGVFGHVILNLSDFLL